MSLSHACVRGHSRAQIAILLLFITIQSWPGRKRNLRGKDQGIK